MAESSTSPPFQEFQPFLPFPPATPSLPRSPSSGQDKGEPKEKKNKRNKGFHLQSRKISPLKLGAAKSQAELRDCFSRLVFSPSQDFQAVLSLLLFPPGAPGWREKIKFNPRLVSSKSQNSQAILSLPFFPPGATGWRKKPNLTPDLFNPSHFFGSAFPWFCFLLELDGAKKPNLTPRWFLAHSRISRPSFPCLSMISQPRAAQAGSTQQTQSVALLV